MQFKAKNVSGGKNFLKLGDGDSVKGVFRGEVYDFRQHWNGGRGVVCIGDKCSYCKEGETNSFRFRLNFVINENGVYTAKIFEQGSNVYAQLKSLHESDYDLEKIIVSITRHGQNKNNTTYTILPVKNGELKNGVLKALADVPLLDLEHPSEEETTTDKTEPEANEFTKASARLR